MNAFFVFIIYYIYNNAQNVDNETSYDDQSLLYKEIGLLKSTDDHSKWLSVKRHRSIFVPNS